MPFNYEYLYTTHLLKNTCILKPPWVFNCLWSGTSRFPQSRRGTSHDSPSYSYPFTRPLYLCHFWLQWCRWVRLNRLEVLQMKKSCTHNEKPRLPKLEEISITKTRTYFIGETVVLEQVHLPLPHQFILILPPFGSC